ncbi:MAG: bifunctional diguanylate cyclase/phosphodiesterase [Actinomycetota bacterium]|nr:bifunctional diguanylate cyclase/phosphodiesterase [Actinomycetota bacterium]
MSTRNSRLGRKAERDASPAGTMSSELAQHTLQALLTHAATFFLVIDEHLAVVTASVSFADELLGGVQPVGQLLPALVHEHPGTPGGQALLLAVHAIAGATQLRSSCTTGWGNDERWFDVAATPLPGGGTLLEVVEISDSVETARAFTRDGAHDSTTGLLSRAGILEWIQRELINQPARQICVAMLQVDQFDIVEETLGPKGSDEVLAQVARHLRENIAPEAAAARADRSTFCVAFPCGSPAEADYRSAELRDAVRQPVTARNRMMRLTASVGASFVTDHWAAARTMREAELGMLDASRRGGNRFAPYVPAEIDARDGVLRKWDALTEALQLRQMEVWFQPIVRLDSGLPVAAEALCRWHHPQYGEISPAEFIPLAEWGAEISRLGAFVQDCAADMSMAVRTASDVPTDDFHVSINVSQHELSAPHFGTSFLSRIMANGTQPGWFAIEVSEETLAMDDPAVMRNLRALADAGVHVTIGDFGTGTSSIERLLAIPVSGVKIARRFVATMLTDPISARIVASTIALVSWLGVDVVAEGVETAAQAAELLRLGCNAGQGYFYAPAVPPTELNAVLRDLIAVTSR